MKTYFNFHHHQKDHSNGIFNVELFSKVPDSLFSAGIHPKDIIENNEEAFSWLREISLDKNCCALGECGLDGLIDIDIEIQKNVFHQQILLANELNKPIIIHCVKKHYDLIPFQKIAITPMIVHGFNKKEEVAAALLQKEFLLCFGKALLHNVSLQEIVKSMNFQKLFLETDNADFDIKLLYEKVAELREVSLTTTIEQMHKNLDFLING